MLNSVNSGFTCSAAFLLLAFSPLTTLAQTADASQSSQIASLISSYTASLLRGAPATSIAFEVAVLGNIPDSLLGSIASGLPTLVPSITSGEDLYSFATDPPVTFAEPAWVTGLPAGVRSDVEGLRTSVVRGEAGIVASVLGVEEAATTGAVATGTAGSATVGAAGATGTSSGAVVGVQRGGFAGGLAVVAAVLAGFVGGVAVL